MSLRKSKHVSHRVIEGEAFDPSPANIEARTTRLAFDNGFEVGDPGKELRARGIVEVETERLDLLDFAPALRA